MGLSTAHQQNPPSGPVRSGFGDRTCQQCANRSDRLNLVAGTRLPPSMLACAFSTIRTAHASGLVCASLLFDISGFFDNINHHRLVALFSNSTASLQTPTTSRSAPPKAPPFPPSFLSFSLLLSSTLPAAGRTQASPCTLSF